MNNREAIKWLMSWCKEHNNTDKIGQAIVTSELYECMDKGIKIDEDMIIYLIKKHMYGLDWNEEIFTEVK